MYVYLDVLVAIIGMVVYFAATNPKVQELGRIMFGCGLLAFLIVIAGFKSLPLLH